MKDGLIPFEFENSEIRIVMKDDQPWFVLSDICKLLEIKNVTQAANTLRKKQRSMFKIGRQGDAIIISESGLYRILMRSDKPNAEPFQVKVEEEILPSIRKNGMYATDVTIDKMINDPDFAITLLTKLKEEKTARIKAEEEKAILIHTNKTYTATEIAKECGLRSAMELNKILHDKGVQFKQNDTWVMYSKYSSLGYDQIKQEVLDNGTIVYHRRFTGAGREFIINLIGKNNNLAA